MLVRPLKATNNLPIKKNDCHRIPLSYDKDQRKIDGSRESIKIRTKHTFMSGDILIIQFGININTCTITDYKEEAHMYKIKIWGFVDNKSLM